jgi:DNA gyrase/topoisomerase IV subunit A
MACLINIESKQEFMIATSNGVIVRQMAENISQQGRMATGVKVQNMDNNDSVISVNKITSIEESDIENNNLDSLSNDGMPEDMDPMDDFVAVDDENM